MKLVWTHDKMLASPYDEGAEDEWHLLPVPPDSSGCRSCILVRPDGKATLLSPIGFYVGDYDSVDAAKISAEEMVK